MEFPVDEAIRELNRAREKAIWLREALQQQDHALASYVRMVVDEVLISISGSLSAMQVEHRRSDNSCSSNSRKMHPARQGTGSSTHPYSSTTITSKSTSGDCNRKRKYGENQINKNTFPSRYLRCPLKREQSFKGKTQVEQSEIITYMGDHSCREPTETLPFIDITSSGFYSNTSSNGYSLSSILLQQSNLGAGCNVNTTSLLPEQFIQSSDLTRCGVSAPMAHVLVRAGRSTNSSGSQSPSRVQDWDFTVEPFLFDDLIDPDQAFDY